MRQVQQLRPQINFSRVSLLGRLGDLERISRQSVGDPLFPIIIGEGGGEFSFGGGFSGGFGGFGGGGLVVLVGGGVGDSVSVFTRVEETVMFTCGYLVRIGQSVKRLN